MRSARCSPSASLLAAPAAAPAWWLVRALRSPGVPQVAEFRALSDTLVMLEIQAAKKELVLLNVKKATRQEVKAHHFVLLRKKVAMLKTIRRERELEAGIKKRESRQADKAVKLDKARERRSFLRVEAQ